MEGNVEYLEVGTYGYYGSVCDCCGDQVGEQCVR